MIVVGAGLSGLAAAFDLSRRGVDVDLLEASDRAGGVVGTVERGGFLFETGPNTVQATSEAFRRLCGDLGIAGRLIATTSAADERYLFLDGRLQKLPSSPPAFLLSPVLSVRARIQVATELFRKWHPPEPGASGTPAANEPTMEAFVRERLGPEATRILAGSFVRGVYAAELTDLGARSAFPRMWKACEEHGGLIRGLFAAGRKRLPELPGPPAPKTALLSFPHGLQELVDALQRSLGDRMRTRAPVESIAREGTGWKVRIRGGESRVGDHVVLAIPAPVAANLLESVASGDVPLDSLRRIRHASVTLVHLGLERAQVPSLPRGFGYLVPPPTPGAAGSGSTAGTGAVPRALGTIFASNLFPGRAPEGCVAVSSFYSSADVGNLDDQGLAGIACEDLARGLRETRAPVARVHEVRRWKDVIPRYAPGHAERMETLARSSRSALPGLHWAGSYVAGVSVEQVIARGRAVAAEILG